MRSPRCSDRESDPSPSTPQRVGRAARSVAIATRRDGPVAVTANLLGDGRFSYESYPSCIFQASKRDDVRLDDDEVRAPLGNLVLDLRHVLRARHTLADEVEQHEPALPVVRPDGDGRVVRRLLQASRQVGGGEEAAVAALDRVDPAVGPLQQEMEAIEAIP